MSYDHLLGPVDWSGWWGSTPIRPKTRVPYFGSRQYSTRSNPDNLHLLQTPQAGLDSHRQYEDERGK